MVKVDDNAENMEICKKFCRTGPTFRDNQLKDAPPHALFYARGKSEKASNAKMTGCDCPGCGVYTKRSSQNSRFIPLSLSAGHSIDVTKVCD